MPISQDTSKSLPRELVAYIDGASRGNPGPASYGVVIQDGNGAILDTLSACIGEATNNVAEYRALLAAVEYALQKQVARLRVYSDSELITKQIQGRYRVQSLDLKPLYERARKLAGQIGNFSIESVPREQNRNADLLANRALDEKSGQRGAPGPGKSLPTFSAIVEAGKLRPLAPFPVLEEGAVYQVRISKR